MSKRFTDKFDFGVIYLTLELRTQPKVGLVKLKFMFKHFIKIMKFDQNYSLKKGKCIISKNVGGKVTNPPPRSVFFSREKKNARENRFWNFLDFFHGHFSFFTPTFWPIFQIFHAHDFFFHGQFFRFFHGKKITFHGQKN